jgi:hypothetical protein
MFFRTNYRRIKFLVMLRFRLESAGDQELRWAGTARGVSFVRRHFDCNPGGCPADCVSPTSGRSGALRVEVRSRLLGIVHLAV